jgi:hypothetical protein
MASSYPTISGSVETDSIFQGVVSELFIPIQNRHPAATPRVSGLVQKRIEVKSSFIGTNRALIFR